MNKTLSELVDDAYEYKTHKLDILCQSSDISFSSQPILRDPATQALMSIVFEQAALEQAAEKLGIPVPYLNKCPKDLQDINLNAWAGRLQSGWKVRLFDDRVRAVLSKDYEYIDNYDVIASVYEVVQDVEYRLALSELTRDSMYLRFLFANKEIKGDHYGSGVYVGNDETGSGSLKFLPFIQRTSCTNSTQWKAGGFVLRHVRSSAAFLKGVIKEKIGQIFGVSAEMLEKVVQAEVDRIPDLQGVVRRIAKEHSLADVTVGNILSGTERNESRMGVVHGLSWAAHYEEKLEDQIKLEELAGAYLMDPDSVFSKRVLVEEL